MTNISHHQFGEAAAGTAWCILRTAGPRTLPLTKSLADAGFEVWTPQRIHRRRRPRSKKIVEREVAIMPTFVFVRKHHAVDLLGILASPVNPHPAFSIFRHPQNGRLIDVADCEIDGLRAEDERWAKAERKSRRRRFEAGSSVKVTDGPAQGLEGIVEESDGRYALVCFGGAVRFKVGTWLLGDEQVENAKPSMGIAA